MEKEILNQEFEIISGKEVKKESLKNMLKKSEKTIIYFYPKDNTPGCSMEAKDFTCNKQVFKDLGINIIGVSKDSIDSHNKFIEKHELNIDLISDQNLILHKYFEVYGEKNNYGKIVMGVIRSTFLLDKEGNILKSWRNVKATGHIEKILRELS